MEDSKRVLIALVLSVVVLWLYSAFVAPPAQPPQQPASQNAKKEAQAPQSKATSSAESQTRQTPAVQPSASLVKGKSVMVTTPLFKAQFNELGAELRHLELLKYFNQPQEQGGNLVMVPLENNPSGTLGVNFPPALPNLSSTMFNASQESLVVDNKNSTGQMVFSTTQGDLKIEKIFHFKADSYAVDLEMKISNQGSSPIEGNPEIQLNAIMQPQDSNSYAFNGLQYQKGGALEEKDLSDLSEQQIDSGNINWMCLTQSYFMGSIVPLETGAGLKRSVRGITEKEVLHTVLVDTPARLEPGASIVRKYMVFYGPRDLDILEPLGHDLANAVDFGWFDIIARPMLMLLKIINGLFFNYGIAIILVTILTKILFWPLAQKSYKSMKQMQKLQPQVARLARKIQRRQAADESRDDAAIQDLQGQPHGGLHSHAGSNPRVHRFLQGAGLFNSVAPCAIHVVDQRPGRA